MGQLPYCHHQRKKSAYGGFRFLSNTGFDTVAVQTALLGPACQAARLRGLTPIMIDWSDLGQGRPPEADSRRSVSAVGDCPCSVGFATPEGLDPSQNRVEEFFIGSARGGLRHSPANLRPLLLADRGFGRASLIRFVQSASGGPNHTGYTVDYVIRLKGDVVVRRADYHGRLRDYSLRKGRILFWPQTLYRSDGAAVINLVIYWARGHREPWYLVTSLTEPRKAVRMYRKRMQPEQYFKDGKQRFGLNRSTVTTTHRLQRLLVGLLLACCLLILLGIRVSSAFRRRVCSRGKLGIPQPGLRILPRHSRPS